MAQLNVPKEAIEKLFEYAKADYARFFTNLDTGGMSEHGKKQLAEFELTYTVGKTYIKLINSRNGSNESVFGWIVNCDDGKFPRGAILKAATWKAPSTNFARGSIYNEDTFKNVRWTGIG